MNQKELNELRKHYDTIDRMAGCWVKKDENGQPHIESAFHESFASISDEKAEQYESLVKKTLGGKIGNQQMELSFPMSAEGDGEIQNLLLSIRDSGLEDTDALDSFYEKFLDTYETEGDYLILLFHDTYDVPVKAKDEEELPDSDTVFSSILCCVCPVTLTKADLCMEEDTTSLLPRNWAVGVPETGFLFPCFSDRMDDIHSILTYNKKTKQPHTELWTGLFAQTEEQETADQKKEAFEDFLDLAVSDGNPTTDAMEDLRAGVELGLSQYSEAQKNADLPDTLDEEALDTILTGAGLTEHAVTDMVNSFHDRFLGGVSAEAVTNKASLKTAELRVERKELRKKLADLEKPTESIEIRGTREVTESEIDGTPCLVIPLNGKEYKIK